MRSAAAAIAVALLAMPLRAGSGDAGPVSSAGAARVARPPLAPLPKPPALALPPASAAELAELDQLLIRLRSEDAAARENAVRELLEARPALLPAIARRLGEIAGTCDRQAMEGELGRARKAARNRELARMRAEKRRGKLQTPDYPALLASEARPASKDFGDLVSVVAMSRMLVHIGTTEAARELIQVYVRFDFLRIHVQLELGRLGQKAVPALIETRQHQAPKIARWAERQLDALGKAIPGEAVQTADAALLADVLRAYGRTRDPDAARIVISFANSERSQIREAARQAVAMMGEVANWQLRDAYENVVGRRAPRDWAWERTARELFFEYDRLRLARTYDLLEKGLAAYGAGKLAEMRAAWDEVLALSPELERRAEMAAGYLAFARLELDRDPDAAALTLARVERIAADEPMKARARSLLVTLDAERLLGRGVFDQTLFRRALELDPSNERARDALDRVQRGEIHARSRGNRWIAAAAIALAAVIGMLVILLRRGRPGSDCGG